MHLVIYDIHAGEEYNKIKRRFYYKLSKCNVEFINKSVLLVSPEALRDVLNVMEEFKKYVVGYVADVNRLEPIGEGIL